MSQLVDGVIGVLEDIAGPVAKALPNIDEGEGDEEEREGGEPEGPLPANCLQGGHVVLRDELLLQDHLRGHDDLGGEDEEVANKDAGGVILAVLAVNGH